MELPVEAASCTPDSKAVSDANSKLRPDKRTPRKLREPHKTPVRCNTSSSSIILQFELVGTPTPSLKIRACGSSRYVKARRRLFSQSDSWSIQEYPPPREARGRAAYYAADSSDETDMHGSVSPDLPVVDSRLKHSRVVQRVKVCASCKTKKTPLWRDAEDGTPYCNACGIRFKKYRICCPVCSYIPRKDEKFGNSCCRCGSNLLHCKLR